MNGANTLWRLTGRDLVKNRRRCKDRERVGPGTEGVEPDPAASEIACRKTSTSWA